MVSNICSIVNSVPEAFSRQLHGDLRTAPQSQVRRCRYPTLLGCPDGRSPPAARGYNGADGEDGGSGNRRNGGVGGLAKFGDASGPRGGPSHGGDAPGWWDHGRASQDVTDTQIIDGTPGEQGPWTDNE